MRDSSSMYSDAPFDARYVDVFDYSLEDIAELTGSTVGAVKAALNRARTKAGGISSCGKAGSKRQPRVATNHATLRRSVQPPRLGRCTQIDQRQRSTRGL